MDEEPEFLELSLLDEPEAPTPKKRRRTRKSAKSTDFVFDLDRCSILEEKARDAARCDMHDMLDLQKDDSWISSSLNQFGQQYSRLFALVRDVWRTRDWRSVRIVVNLLAMSWKYGSENQIMVLEVLFGYLYMTKGLKIGRELLVIGGLKRAGQLANALAEASRAFLDAGDVLNARNAIVRYLAYERDPSAHKNVGGADEQWPMKTAVYFLRLRVIAGLIDLAKEKKDKDLTKYDIAVLLEAPRKRRVPAEDDDDEDDGSTPAELGHELTIGNAEVFLSNMIFGMIRENDKLVNPPWHSFVLIALERCTRDPTLALLKLAAKDSLRADSLLAMKSYVLKDGVDLEADSGVTDARGVWEVEERRDQLKSINYALNRACPLEPYSLTTDDDAQAAFLDSTWDDLGEDRLERNFAVITSYVKDTLCTERRETRKYWRKFWVSVFECVPIWQEFGCLPSDGSNCGEEVAKIMCLVEGPSEENVEKFLAVDVDVEKFWGSVKEVDACWRGKEWAKRNLKKKRAAVFESLLTTGKPGEGEEGQA